MRRGRVPEQVLQRGLVRLPQHQQVDHWRLQRERDVDDWKQLQLQRRQGRQRMHLVRDGLHGLHCAEPHVEPDLRW